VHERATPGLYFYLFAELVPAGIDGVAVVADRLVGEAYLAVELRTPQVDAHGPK
jgi:hypothetical protein